jgi:hypothetical protein
MITNLLRKYPELLDLIGSDSHSNRRALYPVFERDIVQNLAFEFRGKAIHPTSQEGQIPMETLYTHLTTVITDKATRKREFESTRSVRLHWVKHHIEGEESAKNIAVFSVQEPEGMRTYIYDKKEKYVIILMPSRYEDRNEYYLLTAYPLRGGDGRKIENKQKRKESEIY